MKRLLAYTLLFLYCIPVARPFIALTAFNINRQEIATELCENAAAPELHCEGKCYLQKQIEPQDQQQNTAEKDHAKLPSPDKQSEHLPVISNNTTKGSCNKRLFLHIYIARYLNGHLKNINQPPECNVA